MNYKIALIRGDGIGPEVVEQAVGVMEAVGKKFGHTFEYTDVLLGGCATDAVGVSYSTVSRWERENRKPQARAIGKLIIWCKENGIDLSDVEENYGEDKT